MDKNAKFRRILNINYKILQHVLLSMPSGMFSLIGKDMHAHACEVQWSFREVGLGKGTLHQHTASVGFLSFLQQVAPMWEIRCAYLTLLANNAIRLIKKAK